MKLAYVNNTNAVIDAQMHAMLMASIDANGVLPEDFADIFILSCPAGVWLLNWA